MTLQALAAYMQKQMGWSVDVETEIRDSSRGPARWEGSFSEVISAIAADYDVASTVDEGKKAIHFHNP